jgi:opacity protein-like surface antigen
MKVAKRCLLLAICALSGSRPTEAQVVVSVRAGVGMQASEPSLGSVEIYGAVYGASLRVAVSRVLCVELAVERNAREVNFEVHGNLHLDHRSLRQYPIMLGVVFTPAPSKSTRLIVPVGVFVADTKRNETSQAYQDPPFVFEEHGSEIGFYLGVGVEASVSEHLSLQVLTRYVNHQEASKSLRSRSSNYVTAAVGAGFRF